MTQTDKAPAKAREEAAEDRTVRSDLSALPSWRAELSRLALFWERLWPALWPVLGLVGVFLLLGLLGIPQALPVWAHIILLIVFAFGLAGCLWLAARSLRVPDRHAALRRIEKVNGLDHRPLESIEDTLGTSSADSAARALWLLHQQRLRDAVARLRIGWPKPGLIRRDPYALRVGLGVALIAAVVSVGDESWDRLRFAFTPDIGGAAGPVAVKLDAWITPPEYTRQAPVFLTRERDPALAPAAVAPVGGPTAGETAAKVDIKVPEGSQLVLRLSGGQDAPVLVMPGVSKPLDQEEGGGFHLEQALTESGHVSVRQGETELAAWDVTVVPDAAPTVEFSQAPGQTARKALRIDFVAKDDYGVEKVTAKIYGSGALAGNAALAKLAPEEIELTIPGQKSREVKSSSFHDLTPHPWAGLPVNLQLIVQDEVGQLGVSKSVQIVLPERIFAHPVARAIIDQRRQLALYPDKNRGRVAAMLEIIAWEYERYNDDFVAFMSLVSATRRLGAGYQDTPEHVAGVLKLLWDTALRIEDGTLSLSEQSLRDTQQALLDALSKKETTDAELERLMREFEKALDEYMKSLAELMRNNPDLQNQLQQIDPRAMILSQQDLKKMMDQIRELARSGQRDAARQMLSQLQQMMENLRMGRFAKPNQQQQQAMKLLNDLQDVIKQQQELLDKTFREAQKRGQMRNGDPSQRFGQNRMPPGLQQRQPGDGKAPPMASESESQEALRRRLGELMRQLGEMSGKIPRQLGRAEGAMRQSSDQLGEGQAGQAVPPQTEAIDQLQQGARAATQQMMQQLSRNGMMRPGPGQPMGSPPDGDRDPFGRDAENDGRGVSPDGRDIKGSLTGDSVQDARRIRDELRRRAGDRARPAPELDYIERLLDQF